MIKIEDTPVQEEAETLTNKALGELLAALKDGQSFVAPKLNSAHRACIIAVGAALGKEFVVKQEGEAFRVGLPASNIAQFQQQA